MKAAPLFLIALFGVSGCARHMETAAQIDLNQQSREESTAKVDTEIHKVEGPGRVTTTTEEFERSGALAKLDLPTDPGLSPHASDPGPVLRKRTVVVEERGPITTDTHEKADSSAVGARTATLAGKSESEKDSKPSLGIPALGLVLAGLAAAAVFTRSIWIGPLVTLAKRLLGRG